MKKYHWYTCLSNDTSCNCGLNRVSLTDKHFDNKPNGVYVIWHRGDKEQIIKVGQGDLHDRFSKHRKDPKIQKYKDNNLFVSWVIPPASEIDGVERFLGDYLNPIEAEKFPDTEHIEIEIANFIPEPNKGKYRNID